MRSVLRARSFIVEHVPRSEHGVRGGIGAAL
jgi:hypothetical protein